MSGIFEKIIIALLTVLVGMFLIGELSVLKDTHVYEVDAKNYNGYFPLQFENELIECGFIYNNGGYEYPIPFENSCEIIVPNIYVMLYTEENMIEYMVVTYILIDGSDIWYGNINDQKYGTLLSIIFYGFSNYGVE